MKEELRQLTPEEYPASLREIPQPPKVLWARGNFPPKGHKLLSVVGSRALSAYGRSACEMLITGLKGYPISIVSGLALGTDACAHQAALKAGLHTIAVPGSGLNDGVIYPRTNAGLAKDILAAGGLLLSEHPGDYKAQIYDFPSRNRIMVGMSDAVLVIEAGEKSGTLITARMSHEYNRDLLCVPHRIGDAHGYGANLFLRLGAGLVSEPKHILEALGISEQPQTLTLPELNEEESMLYAFIEEPLSREELFATCELPEERIISLLVSLELKGLLKEELGAWRRV